MLNSQATPEFPSVASGTTVCVVIVAYNCNDLLRRTLEALYAQDRLPDRVVVLDNASEPPVSGMPTAPGIPIEFVRSELNTGFAGGNNLVLDALDDIDFVALLNPDAFPAPDWLRSLLEAATAFPEFDMFAGQTVRMDDPALLDGAGDVYHLSGLVWRRWYGRRVPSQAPMEEVFSPCAASALYRLAAIKRAGGFDTDFFCYLEDVDLAFRMRLYGSRCLYVPQATAVHVGSATSGSRYSDFAIYHGHRNVVWAYVKNMPGSLFWAFLPLHLAMNIALTAIYIARGRGGAIFRAKKDALLGIPRMWKKRAEIQRRRVVSSRTVLRVLDKRVLFFRR